MKGVQITRHNTYLGVVVLYFLLLFVVDMQKFPLRMKDNDLLVTELYRDPASEVVTALSVYLTPKTSECCILNLHTLDKCYSVR